MSKEYLRGAVLAATVLIASNAEAQQVIAGSDLVDCESKSQRGGLTTQLLVDKYIDVGIKPKQARLRYDLSGDIAFSKLEEDKEGEELFALTGKEKAESSGRLFIKGAIIFQDENYNYVITPRIPRPDNLGNVHPAQVRVTATCVDGIK